MSFSVNWRSVGLYAGFALLLAVVLTLVRFPYDSLAARLAWQLNQQTGMRMSYGRAETTLLAPGMVFSDVVLRSGRDGTRLFTAERMRFTPRWSKLLQGKGGLAMDILAWDGRLRLDVATDDLSAPTSFDVQTRFENLALEQSAYAQLHLSPLPQARISGEAEFSGPLANPAQGQGSGELRLRDIRLARPNGFIKAETIALDAATAKLHWTPGVLTVDELAFGPGHLRGSLSGEFRPSPRLSASRLKVKGAATIDPELLVLESIPMRNMVAGIRQGRELPFTFDGPLSRLPLP